MAFPPNNLLAILLVSLLASSTMNITSARKVKLENSKSTSSSTTLLARLKLEEQDGSATTSCWDALFELQSCSGEVVLFFLNGETHLGQNCCTAIRTIERHCWPSMMGSLGITTEESDVLRGFCDAEAAKGGGDGGSAGGTPPPSATLDQCYNFPRLLP